VEFVGNASVMIGPEMALLATVDVTCADEVEEG